MNGQRRAKGETGGVWGLKGAQGVSIFFWTTPLYFLVTFHQIDKPIVYRQLKITPTQKLRKGDPDNSKREREREKGGKGRDQLVKLEQINPTKFPLSLSFSFPRH